MAETYVDERRMYYHHGGCFSGSIVARGGSEEQPGPDSGPQTKETPKHPDFGVKEYEYIFKAN